MDRKRVTREELRLLARGRVFTTKEFAELFHRSLPRAAKLAFDLRKRGFLTEVQRGVYASVPLDADPKTFRSDPFLTVQLTLGRTYAFSHQSALVLHGVEQTVRRTIHVSAPGVRPRRRSVGRLVVHVHGAPQDAWTRAVAKVPRGGTLLRVTTPERTLVDLAALPNSMQDYEEDLEAFRSLLPKVNPRTLEREVRNARSASTRARVGHLLQAAGAEASLASRIRRVVGESGSKTSPSYFATSPHVASNRFDARFRLVYPGGD
ncbi:MAG: type IV toxin-antitoxin system AbiEi family antitoxin [Candidatus Lutacidiplasmatales archaeon]